METQELLSVHDLGRRYGDLQALTGVELELSRGEVLGLLGPNGAGKSTCLQILSGNLAPSSGEVRVMGIDLWEAPIRAKRHIGYLPERPPLYDDMRVDEYLEYCARLRRVPRKEQPAAVERAKDRCGLGDSGSRILGNLSKGFRQRVGIAQAIVHDPQLVILDEPTDGLDPVQIREVRGLIRTLREDRGLILSSHILPEVQSVCDRVLILRDGRVLHQARLGQRAEARLQGRLRVRLDAPPSAARLAALPGVATAERLGDGAFRLRLVAGETTSSLAGRLVESGWGLAEVSPERTDLEHMFFELLGGEQER